MRTLIFTMASSGCSILFRRYRKSQHTHMWHQSAQLHRRIAVKHGWILQRRISADAVPVGPTQLKLQGGRTYRGIGTSSTRMSYAGGYHRTAFCVPESSTVGLPADMLLMAWVDSFDLHTVVVLKLRRSSNSTQSFQKTDATRIVISDRVPGHCSVLKVHFSEAMREVTCNIS